MTTSGNALPDGSPLPRNTGQHLSVLCTNKPPSWVPKLDGNCRNMLHQDQLCCSKPGRLERGMIFCDKSVSFLPVKIQGTAWDDPRANICSFMPPLPLEYVTFGGCAQNWGEGGWKSHGGGKRLLRFQETCVCLG